MVRSDFTYLIMYGDLHLCSILSSDIICFCSSANALSSLIIFSAIVELVGLCSTLNTLPPLPALNIYFPINFYFLLWCQYRASNVNPYS